MSNTSDTDGRARAQTIVAGCSGVLGFVMFLITTLTILLLGFNIIGDNSAWLAYALIGLSLVAGWFAGTRVDQGVRRWFTRRVRTGKRG